MGEARLHVRFSANLRSLLAGPDASRLLVAFSGGLDSTVLLHLLRFTAPPPYASSCVVAHFDHRMRAGSAEDAAWVRGVCRAWEMELHSGVADRPLSTEEEARDARYEFLREVARSTRATWIVTAHHADDQAETVFFRIMRGSGLAGIQGMSGASREGVLRPLLPFWRRELEVYAEHHRLRWRDDPTNLSFDPARNRIRGVLLPEIERSIAPGARRNLVALAELARESEAGWETLVRVAEERVVRKDGEAFVLARQDLQGYDPAIVTRLLRRLFSRLGTTPGRIGTRSALQFISDAPSGREMCLNGGIRIRTEFDHVRIEVGEGTGEDRPLDINRQGLEDGFAGELLLGGRSYRVEAGISVRDRRPGREYDGNPEDLDAGRPEEGWAVELPAPGLDFPLLLRSRRPGDRMRLPGGTRSLKKLMIDRRIPRSERARRPVLVDATGQILWVAGIGRATWIGEADEPIFHLAVYDAGSS